MKIEKLAGTIRKNGFLYRLVQRNDKAAIYEQWYDEKESANHWEVFKIKTNKHRASMERLCKSQGRPFNLDDYAELKECFPNDEAFGDWAWSCMSLEKATARFEALSAEEV